MLAEFGFGFGFGRCLVSMHVTNLLLGAEGCRDASKALVVIGPVRVWQCLDGRTDGRKAV